MGEAELGKGVEVSLLILCPLPFNALDYNVTFQIFFLLSFYCLHRSSLCISGIKMDHPHVIGIRHYSTDREGIPIKSLCPTIQAFIEEQRKLCTPDKVYVCDGSEDENRAFIQQLLEDGRFVRLTKYDNW